MKLYDMLSENTADDLFRKIAALNAVINDTAATDGEKLNAQSLKTRLEDKLKANFPNATPSATKPTPAMSRSSNWQDDFDNSWIDKMTKAAADDAARSKHWAENPGAEQEYWADELSRLKTARARFYKTMIPGNVHNAEQMREYNHRIDKILRIHFPELWKKELAKRDAKNTAGYKYRDKKKKEKDKILKTNVKAQKEKSGLGKANHVNAEYIEPLSRFYDKIKDLRLPQYPDTKFGQLYKAKDTLRGLVQLGSGDIRRAWTDLSPEDQSAVKQAAEHVNTLGYKGKGYTPAQKLKILDAMRLSKAKPSQWDNATKYQEKLAKKSERTRY